MSRSIRNFTKALCAVLVAVPLTAPKAETLSEAFTSAYTRDPSLLARRSALQAVDEGYVRAKAQLGPQLGLNLEGGYDVSSLDQQDIFGQRFSQTSSAFTGTGSLVLNQELYSGGHVAHQIDAALADVLSARENLRQFEIQIMRTVVQIYAEVQTDLVLEHLAREHVENFLRLSEETKIRFDRRAATRTDVSESETRLEQARIQLIAAQGRLRESRAKYEAAIGHPAGALAQVDSLEGLPFDVDTAFEVAEKFSPQLRQAGLSERSSKAHIDEAKSANSATVSLQISVSAGPITPYDAHYYGRNVQGLVVLNKPLFTSGLANSRVRESLALNNRDRLNVDAVRRDVILAVSQAWSQLETAKRLENALHEQLQTQRDVAIGVEKERTAGLRSFTDLLNSASQTEAAEMDAARSHGEVLFAEADLLAAMGVLDLRHLVPAASTYDPAVSFRRVSGKAGGLVAGLIESVDRVGMSPATETSPVLRGRLTATDPAEP